MNDFAEPFSFINTLPNIVPLDNEVDWDEADRSEYRQDYEAEMDDLDVSDYDR